MCIGWVCCLWFNTCSMHADDVYVYARHTHMCSAHMRAARHTRHTHVPHTQMGHASCVCCACTWYVHVRPMQTYGVCGVCMCVLVCVVCVLVYVVYGVRVSDSEWLPGLRPGALPKPCARRLPAALAASLSFATCRSPKGELLTGCDGLTTEEKPGLAPALRWGRRAEARTCAAAGRLCGCALGLPTWRHAGGCDVCRRCRQGRCVSTSQ